MDNIAISSMTIRPVAQALCDLSPAGTTLRPTKRYTALVAPQSGYIGANIFQNFVWFYLNDELKQSLESAGFEPTPWKKSSVERRDQNKFQLKKIGVDDVGRHKDLFSRILQHSIQTR